MYSYRHGFKGFAAKLTEDQALQIASKFLTLIDGGLGNGSKWVILETNLVTFSND